MTDPAHPVVPKELDRLSPQDDELLVLANAIDKRIYVTTPSVRALARDYIRLRASSPASGVQITVDDKKFDVPETLRGSQLKALVGADAGRTLWLDHSPAYWNDELVGDCVTVALNSGMVFYTLPLWESQDLDIANSKRYAAPVTGPANAPHSKAMIDNPLGWTLGQCQECGCTTGGGNFCFEHAPYKVYPKADGSFIVDRNGRKHVSFDEPPAAPSRASTMKRADVLKLAHRIGDVACGNDAIVDHDHDADSCHICGRIADMLIAFFGTVPLPAPAEPQEGKPMTDWPPNGSLNKLDLLDKLVTLLRRDVIKERNAPPLCERCVKQGKHDPQPAAICRGHYDIIDEGYTVAQTELDRVNALAAERPMRLSRWYLNEICDRIISAKGQWGGDDSFPICSPDWLVQTAQNIKDALVSAAEPQDDQRCAVCGWPLDPNGKFCRRGNCARRPLPSRFYDPVRAKAEYAPHLDHDPRCAAEPPQAEPSAAGSETKGEVK